MVILGEEDTKLRGVESFAEARKCAALFREHRDEISGIRQMRSPFISRIR